MRLLLHLKDKQKFYAKLSQMIKPSLLKQDNIAGDYKRCGVLIMWAKILLSLRGDKYCIILRESWPSSRYFILDKVEESPGSNGRGAR